MPRSFKIVGFVLVTLLGVYGCAKGPPPSPSSDSSSKARKLDDDYQAAVKTRDEFRLKLSAIEDQQATMQKELEQTRSERDLLQDQVNARTAEGNALKGQVNACTAECNALKGQVNVRTAERDTLKTQVSARTAERDALQIQYEKFRSNLKELLGSADAAMSELKLPTPKPQADLGAELKVDDK